MNESIVTQVLDTIRQASNQYFKLVIIVAPSGGGKTKVLQDVSKEIKTSMININLELSRLMNIPAENRQCDRTKPTP